MRAARDAVAVGAGGAGVVGVTVRTEESVLSFFFHMDSLLRLGMEGVDVFGWAPVFVYSEKLRMSWITVIHAQHPRAKSPSTPAAKSIVKVCSL
jgi:hypothetical protein